MGVFVTIIGVCGIFGIRKGMTIWTDTGLCSLLKQLTEGPSGKLRCAAVGLSFFSAVYAYFVSYEAYVSRLAFRRIQSSIRGQLQTKLSQNAIRSLVKFVSLYKCAVVV